MTKHTPGPWRVGDARHTVFGPKTGAASPETIATMGKNNFRENARLIAAAPEMLEALKVALDLEGWQTTCAPVENHFRQIRAAIAKAEGRDV